VRNHFLGFYKKRGDIVIVDYEFYTENGYSLLDENDATQYLSKAERQINTICQGRLTNGYFDNCSEDIQNTVKIIICEQAEYLVNYETDNGVNYGNLKSYRNGSASFEFDNSKSTVSISNGVSIKSDLLSELEQTGLAYRGLN
jgi:hypothetical protein